MWSGIQVVEVRNSLMGQTKKADWKPIEMTKVSTGKKESWGNRTLIEALDVAGNPILAFLMSSEVSIVLKGWEEVKNPTVNREKGRGAWYGLFRDGLESTSLMNIK